jgi:hypothetical protein
VDYFFLLTVKSEQAGRTLTSNTSKNNCEGVVRMTSKKDFAEE